MMPRFASLLIPMIVVALASGCAEPVAPAEAPRLQPRAIIVIDGRPQVFNFQLRSIDDPNIVDDPNLRPHGNLQLKLYANEDGTFTLAWKGKIFNPGGESFTGWSMNDLDNGRPALFVAIGEVDGISDRLIDPEDATVISGELAAALFGNPRGTEPEGGDRIGVVFFTAERPDGPGENEDFGLEQVTGRPSDRYGFRTSPLRNVALQSAFMHNGAFVRLEDAIRHHLDVETSARNYSPRDLAPDLRGPTGPIEPVLRRLDPRLRTPLRLSDTEVANLVDFVRNGLLDPGARPERLRRLVPERLPSGRAPFTFQFR